MSEGVSNSSRVIAGRFALGAEIERRPTATIYRAADESLGGREVAVKVFLDSPGGRPEIIQAFEAEVQKLRAASHSALVPILAGGTDDHGLLFIAMEFVPGKTLRDTLRELQGPMPADQATHIAAELASALHEIHEQGLAHGHLDARAVLLKGEEPRLAGYYPKAIEELQKQSTSAGRIVGEPFYISPEQLSGSSSVDARSDIYSLSVLLFEMVTGRRPFESPSAIQAAMMRITEPAPSPRKFNPEISPLLEAALMKGLAKDARHRFQTASELRDALTAASGVTKNPFVAMAASAQPERMTTSTIAVSMSADSIREMLKTHAAPAAPTEKASPQQMDVTATAMGFQAVQTQAPQASFMLVSGAERGKRFSMTRQQIIIGSDPACDVVIKGKSVPARYALCIQRGEQFVAAPFGSEPLRINGEKLKNAEHQLTRGDVIDVGDSALRFIAPGEVFTLRDDVVDRVIDRPKSRTGVYMLAGVVVLGALAFGSFTIYQERVEQQRRTDAQKKLSEKKTREQQIAQLREEGDAFLKAGALREPPGANAEERFRDILELNPEDNFAKRRLAEIDERLQRLAEENERRQQLSNRLNELRADAEGYFSQRQYVSPPGRNAREKYLEILKIEPADAAAKARIAEIDQKMNEMLGAVRERLALAAQYKEQGRYIEPAGENASEILQGILEVDPKNGEAREMMLDMASRSMFRGEIAKGMAKLDDMRKAFLTAQALGVDPAYIDRQSKGTEIMARSKGTVFIVDTGGKDDDLPKSSGSYLDTAEIHKRVARLKLDAKLSGKSTDRIYIEMRR